MDEGLAAVAAGGFALIGAVIGGAAAVWGARQQVRAQAAVEHEHWSRQMRREAYEGFITGAFEVINSFTLLTAAIMDGGREAACDQLERKLSSLSSLGTRVALAGPDNLNHLAQQAADRLNTVGGRLLDIDSPSGLVESDLDPMLTEAGRATDDFTIAARRVLQHPPN